MSKQLKLKDLIIESADHILIEQREDGSFPAGHNGVRFDPETPARNTGNWLIILLKVYEWTGEEKYLEPARKALNYLLSKDIRPMGATIWHRKKPEKDFCNGLIGQAFTIEALVTAYEVLGSQQALETAENLFLMHPFNENVGVWQRVAVDGSYLSYDDTFNHQLCFAEAGAYLYKIGCNEAINRQLIIFLSKLSSTFKVYPVIHKGLIMHPLFSTTFRHDGFTGGIKRIAISLKQYRKKRVLHAMGYHAFNMYAFSMLYNIYSDHYFWQSNKFQSTLKYMQSREYSKVTESTEFSKPYSRAGFETAYIERAFTLETFYPNHDPNEISRLIIKQFLKTFNFDTFMMDKCSADSVTQAARLYKATRLNNIELQIPIGEDNNG